MPKKEILKSGRIIKMEADSEVILQKLSKATTIEEAEQFQRDYNNIMLRIEMETNIYNNNLKKNTETVSVPNLGSRKQRMRN